MRCYECSFDNPSENYASSNCWKVIFALVVITLSILGIGSSQNQPLRTVNLKIAVDEEFRSKDIWRLEIKRLIMNSSQDFEMKFGIRFRIKSFVFWFSDDSRSSLLGLLNDLRRKVPPKESDVVLGFTAQPHLDYDLSGAAAYLNGYIVIKELRTELAMKRILMHEFCHLFGAIDIREKGSVMESVNPGSEFDDFTRRIIFLNKFRNFNPCLFPLPEDKWEEAISLYSQREKLKRKEVENHILLALIHLERREYDVVIKECKQAIEIEPDLPEVYNILGIAYRRKGQVDRAIKEYQKVLRFQPGLSEVHYNLGIAYTKKGKIDEAIKEYQKSIELNPYYAKAYSNLGYIYLQKKMIDEAIRECQKALKIFPRLPEALSTLGGALILKEEFAEAETVSRMALEINPRLSDGHNNLRVVYFYLEKYALAWKHMKKAEELGMNVHPDFRKELQKVLGKK